MSRDYITVQTPEGPAAAVLLPSGRKVLLDHDVAEALGFPAVWEVGRGYAGVGRKATRLHRLVCPPPEGLEVDHINGNRLDNRRSNLRAVTSSHNQLAAHFRRRGVSGYRGVRADRRRWSATVKWHGRQYWGGSFATRLVAALARDDLVVRVTGHADGLNRPLTIPPNGVRDLLASFGTDRFGVVFVRRSNGAVRRMICRTADAPPAGGAGLRFDPARRALWPVLDLREKEYRFIPMEGVLCLTHQRKRYRMSLCAS